MAVRRLAAVKPVVASFSAVAASGGYYAACPAKVIVANPGTITGSIGVMSQYANVQELLQKIGVSFESFTSGKLKDAGSPFRPLSPEQRAYLEGIISDLNKQFSGDVAENRNLSKEAAAAIADGRAMTGARAKELGLVDALGGREDAFDLLKDITGLTVDIPVLRGPKKDEGLWGLLTSRLSLSEPEGLALITRLAAVLSTPAAVEGR